MYRLYLVGGAVRQKLIGRPTDDYDFAVESDSYTMMLNGLKSRGFVPYLERPEYVTVRGFLPRVGLGSFGGFLPPDPDPSARVTADFTLCRMEAMYSDNRHPDVVTPAPLKVDLSRRDFTMNAIAVSEAGRVVDPYDGTKDIKAGVMRCVESPVMRFEEDPLRMLRAVRFAVMTGFSHDEFIMTALQNPDVVQLIRTLPRERIAVELQKALRHDWHKTLNMLFDDYPLLAAVLRTEKPELWFKVTMEAR